MTRRVLLLISAGLLLAVPAGRAVAQTVAGRLIDRATRGVVRGVAVKLTDTANVVVAEAVSDTAGEFLINLERPGKYRLAFSAGQVPLGGSELELSASDFHQRFYLVDVPREEPVYFEFQVAKRVAPQPGNPGPRYPEELRMRSIEGDVLVQFVVDTSGRAMPGTVRILRSADPGFTFEVQSVLWRMRFFPAELKDGRRVRQLVQMPFQFRLTR